MRVMGKARQASLHLHFSLTHLLFRLYSWAPGMNTSRRVKLSSREGPKWFLFSPAPEVIRLPNLAVLAVTGYGQEGDAKPNLETVMKKYRERKIDHLTSEPMSQKLGRTLMTRACRDLLGVQSSFTLLHLLESTSWENLNRHIPTSDAADLTKKQFLCFILMNKYIVNLRSPITSSKNKALEG